MVFFNVLDKKIYVDETTGIFSYTCFYPDDSYYIDYDDIISSFKPNFINICLCVSNSCNFNCDYCFNKRKDNRKMPFETAKQIIDFMVDSRFPDCDKYYVDVSGYGEPLLNLDCILKINDYCKKKSNLIYKDIIVSFVTNGYLLTENVVKKLQNNGILFGVSIDGNKIMHDSKRKTLSGDCTYERVFDNVKRIEKREYLGCAVTLSDENVCIEKLVDELIPYFSTISIKPVRDASKGLSLQTIEKWNEEYKKLTIRIMEDAKKQNIAIIKTLVNGDDYFGKFIYRSILKTRTVNRCDYGISRFCFTVDGKLFGCAPASEFPELEIKEINSKRYLENQIYQTKENCSVCPYYLFCGGECSIETRINGKKNDTLCFFKQNLIRLSMYISLELEEKYSSLYIKIFNFCIEKSKRFSKDNDLYDYLSRHTKFTFLEGKENYYKEKRGL